MCQRHHGRLSRRTLTAPAWAASAVTAPRPTSCASVWMSTTPSTSGPAGIRWDRSRAAAFNDNAFLTFSGDTGTVVYTQMKVVENLPVTLTSPRIWEALGLPLTPFEDTARLLRQPGPGGRDIHPPLRADDGPAASRPTVRRTATARPVPVVLDSSGNPVQGFGDAPIDIPNCERCHSAFNDPHWAMRPTAPTIWAPRRPIWSSWRSTSGMPITTSM